VSNEVRIIGGLWRSRKIHFPAMKALRPTPDRVRETLFNWLQGAIEGTTCLDLYAGSGALGFEAASRGASRVVQVESDGRACVALRRNCALLDARQIEIVHAEAGRYLSGPARIFDIVFLDPPFRRDLLLPSCRLLETRGWLAEQAWIYLETEAELCIDGLPQSWRMMHSKQCGELAYRLCRRLH
jgi:16S rRNA (guanine966-N2)-methyltransferase